MAPTILELAGFKVPENIHGKSISGILSGEKQELRDAFIYEGLGNYGGAKPNLTVVSKDYRYIITYEDEKLYKVVFRELYNQKNDKDEMKNLIDNPSYDSLKLKMNSIIKQHRNNVLNLNN